MNQAHSPNGAQDLGALFPGLTGKPAAHPPLDGGPIRVFDLIGAIDPAHPGHSHTLAFVSAAQSQRACDFARRLFGAYWADPRRMFWTPILAGGAARLWELTPGLFPPDLAVPARLLANSAPDTEPMDDLVRSAVAELALAGGRIFRNRLGEGRALAALGLDPDLSLALRVERLAERLGQTNPPVAWVAVHLPAALAVDGGTDRLLLAGGHFRELGEHFAALAERQGITTWEKAVADAIFFWRDARGSAMLEALAQPAALPPTGKVAGSAPRHRSHSSAESHAEFRRLEAKLERAKREAEAARAESESRLAQMAALERQVGEARQSRNRVAERLRRVEADLAALRVAAPPPPRLSPLVPARPEHSAPWAPEVALDPPVQRLEAIFADRQVYLYTGVERAGAREAMARALERHGAICEAYDGNRISLLGPERFPEGAIVIIETSHLCHSASDRIAARARASGAWYYLGATGSAALARRVAERWWLTRRGAA